MVSGRAPVPGMADPREPKPYTAHAPDREWDGPRALGKAAV